MEWLRPAMLLVITVSATIDIADSDGDVYVVDNAHKDKNLEDALVNIALGIFKSLKHLQSF